MRRAEMQSLLALPWAKFNTALMKIEDEVIIGAIIGLEDEGKNRTRVKLRLHARMNKLRAERERREIMR
mgnify:CR=1 FL=1